MGMFVWWRAKIGLPYPHPIAMKSCMFVEPREIGYIQPLCLIAQVNIFTNV